MLGMIFEFYLYYLFESKYAEEQKTEHENKVFLHAPNNDTHKSMWSFGFS
jgi:hypothetical protein